MLSIEEIKKYIDTLTFDQLKENLLDISMVNIELTKKNKKLEEDKIYSDKTIDYLYIELEAHKNVLKTLMGDVNLPRK